MDLRAESFELCGYFSEPGVPAGQRAVCRQGRDIADAFHSHDRSADWPARVRSQRSAGAHSAGGGSECGADARRIGGGLSGRHIHGDGGHQALSTRRVQSCSGYATADLPGSRARRTRNLRDHTYLPRPGRITLTFGPLVMPHRAVGADWAEVVRLRDQTRQIIGRNSGEPLL